MMVMAQLRLDVIIPVRDRTTIVACLAQLQSQAQQLSSLQLGQILLCDGGSSEADCLAQLAEVSRWPGVELLSGAGADDPPGVNRGWNKGRLLNQGLAKATAPIVLISDVDILWTRESLEALAIAAASRPDCLYHIQSVVESQPWSPALERRRYAYRISPQEEGHRLEIYAAPPPGPERPGCGLVCAGRSLFRQLGGYRQDFWGWGWEDQDLLMRAQLLGYGLDELGRVTHLSHPDSERNGGSGQRPQDSRDRNLLRCLAGLIQGKLRGDLAEAQTSQPERAPAPRALLQVNIPPELLTLAEATQESLTLPPLLQDFH